MNLQHARRMPRAPLPEPLRGLDENSFTRYTITRRFPRILRGALEGYPWHEPARKNLEQLIREIPDQELTPFEDDSAPDMALWRAWMRPYWGQTWLQAPWFVVETYFFRRILAATGFYQAGEGFQKDPYEHQKQDSIAHAPAGLRRAKTTLEASEKQNHNRHVDIGDQLSALLRLAVWGNQADLSMWAVGDKTQPEHSTIGEGKEHLLADDSQAAARLFTLANSNLQVVDFILDNVGLELAYDFLLADFLLRRTPCEKIRFHAKPYPTYVSDATVEDVFTMLAALRQSAQSNPTDAWMSPILDRLNAHLDNGSIEVTSDLFWISPLSGWEIPDELYTTLAQSDLLINKGDANYRRWVGDRHWRFDTPLEAVLNYLPSTLLALRVLKAEVLIGLKPGQAESMFTRDPEWLFNGKWAVIQLIA